MARSKFDAQLALDWYGIVFENSDQGLLSYQAVRWLERQVKIGRVTKHIDDETHRQTCWRSVEKAAVLGGELGKYDPILKRLADKYG